MSKPEVVCLCGSCKFWDEFQKQASRLTLEGKIVLSVGVGKTDNGQELTRLVKSKLDVLHLRKIDLADSIFVIDVDGYIGESTEREIEYAISHGKRVLYFSGTFEKYKPVSSLKVSLRTSRVFEALGIETVGGLCDKSEAELLAVKNFGGVCLREIRHKLKQVGLALKEKV